MYECTDDELVGWIDILDRRMMTVHGVCLCCMSKTAAARLIDKFGRRCCRYGRDLTGALQFADRWMERYLAKKGI